MLSTRIFGGGRRNGELSALHSGSAAVLGVTGSGLKPGSKALVGVAGSPPSKGAFFRLKSGEFKLNNLSFALLADTTPWRETLLAEMGIVGVVGEGNAV